MRKIVILTMASTAAFLFGCGEQPTSAPPAAQTTAPTAQATLNIPKDGLYNSRGRVTKIDMKLGSVELNHEDIPGVMPAMIMEFFVKDPEQLRPLKVGDKVDFVLEYKHPSETIASIKRTD